MSKIKRTLTLSEGLHLCNELISGTEIQKRLIDFKISRNIHSETVEDLGRVGRHYWKKFLRRNKDVLRAKPGRKYAIDRSSWTTIMNFSNMYNHAESVMIESGIAHKLQSPQWMDKHGNVVEDESQSAGCKVEVQLDRPHMALVMDEVGCNTSQDTDKRVGRELFLTGKHDEAYKSVSTRSNHFTVLGVTALDGRPVLCVVIMTGKQFELPVATGIDWEAINTTLDYDIEEGKEIRFLRENRGDGNIFPEGPPVCDFNGTKIPSFVTFSEKKKLTKFYML